MTTIAIDTPTKPNSTLSPRALESTLRAVEPGVVLAPPWLLQNVIAAHRGLGGSPFMVPHRKVHLISRARLLAIAAEESLSLPDDLPPVPSLVLLARQH